MRHAVVTGGAGFIGSHLVDQLLAEGNWRVAVVDDFHDFYPRQIKLANISSARDHEEWTLHEGDVTEIATFDIPPPDVIVHIAARAGVRPSFDDPAAYYRVNVTGTDAVMRFAASVGCQRVVLASSSSVYGANPRLPWREDDLELRPISPYAVSKLAAERIADVYAQRYDLSVAALRLFTVYGPRQRPDLAIRKFAESIAKGNPVTLFGDGSSVRDYTFVSDIVRGIRAAFDLNLPGVTSINLGAGHPVTLMGLVRTLESALGREAKLSFCPEQPGDVSATHASVELASEMLAYRPRVGLDEGIAQFLEWSGYERE